MRELIARTDLTTTERNTVELGIGEGWGVYADQVQAKKLKPISGLALAVLIDHIDTCVPKSELPQMMGTKQGTEDYLGEGVFEGVSAHRGGANAVTRAVNSFIKTYRTSIGANVLHLGQNPDARWILVQDASDEEAVLELIREQHRLSELDIKTIQKKNNRMRDPEAEIPNTFRDRVRGENPRILVPATREQKQQFYKLLVDGELGSTITRSELSAWVRAQGVSGIRVDDIVSVALEKGYVVVGPNNKANSGSNEVTYIRA